MSGAAAEPVKELETEKEETESVSSSSASQRRTFGSSVLQGLQLVGSVIKFSAIQLVFPFVNGMMIGFGEIFANELGIRWGFLGAHAHPMRINIRNRVEQRLLEEEKKRS
ncbi:outer membrane protein TOM13-domain-containing protein [Myxozyma melibiosi]|uniref:Outer membrane protein TOM13-domain-containing protein n=1 Tax=Myxozyma melibiosi TaxID=54550 RepID=A0ABR1F378_9ASCO